MNLKLVLLVAAGLPLAASFLFDHAVLNTFVFVEFSILLLAGVFRTLYRAWEYHSARIPIPDLLIRDSFSRAGLGLSFGMILLVRAAGWAPYVTGQEWWILLSGVPALIGVAVYDYFEFFIINKRRVREQREPRELREARETPQSILQPREPREPRPERPPEED